jgi:hypothetical protein
LDTVDAEKHAVSKLRFLRHLEKLASMSDAAFEQLQARVCFKTVEESRKNGLWDIEPWSYKDEYMQDKLIRKRYG